MQFLGEEVIMALHEIALEIGEKGRPGVFDRNSVLSALSRPQNAHLYDDEDDPCVLAAKLCYGIAKNHGFNDANKRTAALAAETFLAANDFTLTAPDDLFEEAILAMVADVITEAQLADWFMRFVKPG